MTAETSSGSVLFVATDLASYRATHPLRYGGDVWSRGRCFRELDPMYYGWLSHRMELLRGAAARDEVPRAGLAMLELRFAEITAYAHERFGQETLAGVIAKLDPQGYRPPKLRHWIEDAFGADSRPPAAQPTGHFHPSGGGWPFHEPVTPEAVVQVDAIRDRALELGWTLAELYQNRGRHRFPCCPGYGLVCFLGLGRAISGVSREAIEIRPSHGDILRFRSRTPGSADVSSPAPVCNPGAVYPGRVKT